MMMIIILIISDITYLSSFFMNYLSTFLTLHVRAYKKNEIIINDTNNNTSSVTRIFCFFLIDKMYY